jgi:hypothetical protein
MVEEIADCSTRNNVDNQPRKRLQLRQVNDSNCTLLDISSPSLTVHGRNGERKGARKADETIIPMSTRFTLFINGAGGSTPRPPLSEGSTRFVGGPPPNPRSPRELDRASYDSLLEVLIICFVLWSPHQSSEKKCLIKQLTEVTSTGSNYRLVCSYIVLFV